MNLALWLRFAARDLRSGLQGFWIFLTCLALGTAAIAIIGSLTAAVERGLEEQGQPLLGGDVEFSLIHRQASPEELAFIDGAGKVGKVATLRAMAVAGAATTLVEVKSVDASYPLYGALTLEGGAPVTGSLEQRAGLHGAVADPLLLGRLGLKPGDRVKLGSLEFEIRGIIVNEPDRISDGFVLGPRLLVSEEALRQTELVQPGSLITWRYRLKLTGDTSLKAARAVIRKARAQFPDAGWRLRAHDNAASGAERFVERLGYFMTLVGTDRAHRRRRRHRQRGFSLRQPAYSGNRHPEMSGRPIARCFRHLSDRNSAGCLDRHRHRHCRGGCGTRLSPMLR